MGSGEHVARDDAGVGVACIYCACHYRCHWSSDDALHELRLACLFACYCHYGAEIYRTVSHETAYAYHGEDVGGPDDFALVDRLNVGSLNAGVASRVRTFKHYGVVPLDDVACRAS